MMQKMVLPYCEPGTFYSRLSEHVSVHLRIAQGPLETLLWVNVNVSQGVR